MFWDFIFIKGKGLYIPSKEQEHSNLCQGCRNSNGRNLRVVFLLYLTT